MELCVMRPYSQSLYSHSLCYSHLIFALLLLSTKVTAVVVDQRTKFSVPDRSSTLLTKQFGTWNEYFHS